MSTRKLKLKSSEKEKYREVEKIDDINGFRGFYFTHDGEHFKSNFNVSILTTSVVTEYSRGFKLSEGRDVIEHLYNKLKKGEKLNKNEMKAFDENVDPVKPSVQSSGMWYDFAEVLTKGEVSIPVWTVGNITAREKLKIKERFGDYETNIKVEEKEKVTIESKISNKDTKDDLSDTPCMPDFFTIK